MLKNAARLCDAKFGNIYRWDGDALHLVATQNVPAAFLQARGRSPLRPSPQDGRGAWRDNVFVERLWRSVKYEEVYLRAYEGVSDARAWEAELTITARAKAATGQMR